MSTQEKDSGSPFFSDSEIDSLRQQLRENSDQAAEAATQAGVKLHPRVAALYERLQRELDEAIKRALDQ